MQRSGATPTHTSAPAFFTSLFGGTTASNSSSHHRRGGGGSGSNGYSSVNNSTNNGSVANNNSNAAAKSPGKSRPGTSSSGDPNPDYSHGVDTSPRQHNVLHKEPREPRDSSSSSRRPSFGRKPSFPNIHILGSPSKGSGSSSKRRASGSSGSAAANGGGGGNGNGRPALHIVTGDSSIPPIPDIPDIPLTASAPRPSESILSPASVDYTRMLSRTAPTPVNGFASTTQLAPPAAVAPGPQSELHLIHQHIQETANKRISTLDYLRKAHEGRVYWFNTLLFEKPDLQRMPYFESRKLARRATNYLLLGLSLPTVVDLNSNTPVDFLRSLNALLAEFDSFQQLHSEHGTASSSSLSRARIPQMFRRATAATIIPGASKTRRSSNATTETMSSTAANASSVNLSTSASGGGGIGYALEQVESNPGGSSGGPGGGGGTSSVGGSFSIPSSGSNTNNHNSTSSTGTASTAATSVISFAPSESTDLLPGEEYTHLLTPNLPFDPDFFETFATLCDVLIDTYTRLLGLLPTPRECGGAVAELFTKADGKVRKILIQNIVKEFEDAGRAGVKAEVASVGKVVLGGLM